jgi:outer membrane protein assembly factor BamE (lipoprotein component of BamABCDE complex)
MKSAVLLAIALLLGACAGRDLVQGQSMAQVEAAMGRPQEQLVDAAGYTVWFYPTAPNGRETWAARFLPEGPLVALEQRLTKENMARVVPGATTKGQVREIFGPPWKAYPLARLEREEWDYPVLVDNRWFDYLLRFSGDGVVREAYLLHDPIYDGPSRN